MQLLGYLYLGCLYSGPFHSSLHLTSVGICCVHVASARFVEAVITEGLPHVVSRLTVVFKIDKYYLLSCYLRKTYNSVLQQ